MIQSDERRRRKKQLIELGWKGEHNLYRYNAKRPEMPKPYVPVNEKVTDLIDLEEAI